MTERRSDARRFSPAVSRNAEPIVQVLATVLPQNGRVLEIASGSGEHIVHFARAFPDLTWQPSDPSAEARDSISDWVEASGMSNVLPPLALDAAEAEWPVDAAAAIVCINMVHISPWEATLGLLDGAARLLAAEASLYLYGPYRQRDAELVPSNAAFDESLRARDPRWGLRELESVADEANACGLVLDRVIAMPANNLSIVFRRI